MLRDGSRRGCRGRLGWLPQVTDRGRRSSLESLLRCLHLIIRCGEEGSKAQPRPQVTEEEAAGSKEHDFERPDDRAGGEASKRGPLKVSPDELRPDGMFASLRQADADEDLREPVGDLFEACVAGISGALRCQFGSGSAGSGAGVAGVAEGSWSDRGMPNTKPTRPPTQRGHADHQSDAENGEKRDKRSRLQGEQEQGHDPEQLCAADDSARAPIRLVAIAAIRRADVA